MNMAKTRLTKPEFYQSKIGKLSKDEAGAIIFWRIVIIAALDLIVAWLFHYITHTPAEVEAPFYMNVRPVLAWVFWGLFAASVVYFIITIVKKIDTSAYVMTPAMISAATLYLAVVNTGIFYNVFRITPYLFYTMTMIVSVLFAVYYIYTILLYKK